MWAMTPRFRTSFRSVSAFFAMIHLTNQLTTKARRAQRRRQEDKGEKNVLPSSSRLLCALRAFVVTATRSPREVAERLVRLGHLDRLLALAHGLTLALVRGHQFLGEAEVRCPAGLGPD